ncbi:unnamed protein product [Pleuronectes platessa]|uniref:Uncharacterized protein n=1 Tax=Pleuronectes platessa TaxID=8262 RepID=A0A9N7TQ39_PLEPL|nr:unnamed protein product [Pleuronectes platessa]
MPLSKALNVPLPWLANQVNTRMHDVHQKIHHAPGDIDGGRCMDGQLAKTKGSVLMIQAQRLELTVSGDASYGGPVYAADKGCIDRVGQSEKRRSGLQRDN